MQRKYGEKIKGLGKIVIVGNLQKGGFHFLFDELKVNEDPRTTSLMSWCLYC